MTPTTKGHGSRKPLKSSGQSNVARSIAKKSSLKRPTAYVIAEELVEKGLVVPVAGEQKRMYIARSPEAYIDEVGERVREARRILPELLALQKKTSEKPNILYCQACSSF